MTAPAIHWMIGWNDPRLGVPTGRIACGPPDAGELITAGAWSCRMAKVTCPACKQKIISDLAHNPHKPTTD